MVAHLLASKQGTLNSTTVTVLRVPWLTWQAAVLYVYTHTHRCLEMCVLGHWVGDGEQRTQGKVIVVHSCLPQTESVQEQRCVCDWCPARCHTHLMHTPCSGGHQPRRLPHRPLPPVLSRPLLTSAAELLPVGGTEEREALPPAGRSRL